MTLFLYLQFPALQLDSVSAAQDHNLPFAVVDAQHRLIQLNAAASRQGITLGMSLGSAAALCHQLQLLPYQPQLQAELLASAAQQLYQHSADIALDPPDGLYLKLNNMLTLYQGLTGYWQVVQSALHGMGYRYYYATGKTALAAKCLARQQLNLLSSDEVQLQQALLNSPLNVTELDQEMQQQLQRLGLHRLEQLLALSQAELARRFDHTLLHYLGRLRGDFYHALEYIQPQQGFSRSLELLYDITDTTVLRAPLNGLLQQLQQQLQTANALCHQLLLQLRFRQRPALTLTVGSAQGEYRAEQWQALCQLQLDRLQLSEPVVALKLEVARFYPQQAQSSDLFQPRPGTMSALQLVSLLQARLGQAAVSGLSLQNQHLPEQASSNTLPLLSAATSVGQLKQRPAFLLPRPLPLREQVQLNAGPERLWPDPWQLSSQRDYFTARSNTGQWLWLYRTAEQHWFVQGLFS
jgi:protein ImuB